MRMPSSIKIGGHEISIKITSDKLLNNNACIFEASNEILISDDFSESNQAQGLLHEVVEFANTAYDLKLVHYQISALSECLFDFLRNNDIDFRNKEEHLSEEVEETITNLLGGEKSATKSTKKRTK